jgi:glycosyltransferase involved in cell wall biosynthesis
VEQYALAHAAALRDAGLEPEARAAYTELIARAPSTSALATAGVSLARLGDPGGAERAERALTERGATEAETLLRAGEIACSRGDLRRGRTLAEQALAGGVDGPAAVRTAARILEQSGELTPALTLARRTGDTVPERRLAGSLRAYDPSWTPPVTRMPRPPRRAGRVLNLLETSLPQATSGYAHRARTLVGAQQLAGFQPVAATRLGFPANRRRAYAIVETVDGIVHHRRTLPHVTRYTTVPLDEQLETNAAWVIELAGAIGPEAVVAGTPHLNGLLALVMREAAGVPFAYDVRGFSELTWAVRKGADEAEMMALRRAAETRCMAAADVVTTLSETMRAEIVGRGVPADRVVVTPHAVDVTAWRTVTRDPALARRLDLEERTVVGIVSSLVGYEGVHTLLEAIALARREEPAIAGLVVGDGDALVSLRSQAERLGVGDHVRFTGRLPHAEVPPYYGLIDVFACPRDDHRVCRLVTPLKPFEAMAAGCCLVVSDLPALREAVDDGRAGALVTPGDPRALASELVALAREEDRRRELAAAGRLHVAEHHDLPVLASVVGETLGSLGARSGGVPPADAAAQA